MSKEIDIINDEGTPITETTFKKYDWEKIEEEDDDGNYYYWVLPLPIDNPDENAPTLLSCSNDEWETLGIPKDTYVTELADMNGLGYCEFEEEILLLYRALTGRTLPLKDSNDNE